jgi:hypothetical protein
MGLTGFVALAAIALLMLKRAAILAWRGSDVAALLILASTAFIFMGGVHDMFYQRTFWLALGLSMPIFIRVPSQNALQSRRPSFD